MKMYLLVLTNVLLLIQSILTSEVAGITQNADIEFRIYYGSPAKIQEFPHFVSLYNCGAAILSSRWVVTAAHCVEKPRERKGFLWVGGEQIRTSQKYQYDKCIIHPKYSKDPVIVNDIALLRVTQPLQFNNKVHSIGLPMSNSSTMTQVRFVGKGRDESGRQSPAIKQVNFTRLTAEQCISLIPPSRLKDHIKPYLPTLAKAVICAKRSEDLPGICMGDSGGPLADKDSLVGLASFIGDTDCGNTRIGFFTYVANYLLWIKQHTGL